MPSMQKRIDWDAFKIEIERWGGLYTQYGEYGQAVARKRTFVKSLMESNRPIWLTRFYSRSRSMGTMSRLMAGKVRVQETMMTK